MKDETTIIREPVRLAGGSEYCDSKCAKTVNDSAGYLIESSKSQDFIMAVINLKKFVSFEDFLMKAIGPNTRAKYRQVLKEGYYVKLLSAEERNSRRDDLYAINTSTDERQGQMSAEYYLYPDEVSTYTCPFHFHETYGVFSPDHTWIGYIYPQFSGEICRTYRILGHYKYFGRMNFMILLMFDTIKDIMNNHREISYFIYHLMYVGKQGLQDWKRSAGFRPLRFTGQLL